MEFKIEMRAAASVNPAPYNPRRKLKRGDPEYEDIAESLREFGLIQNLILNDRTGNVVAGHQRMQIGQKEFGMTDFPFVIVDLDDESERRLNIKMNRVGEGIWDMAKLGEMMRELEQEGSDVFSLGFTPSEVEELLGTKPKATKSDPDDDAPNKPAEPLTKEGDQYLFVSNEGDLNHFLRCGDSTSAADVAALMGEEKARILFTDPPYGVDYDSSARGEGRKQRGKLENDELATLALFDFLKPAFVNAYNHTVNDCAAYVYHAAKTQIHFERALNAAGFEMRSQLLWIKHFALSRTDYHWAHEPCFYAAKAGAKTPWFGDRCETTVFSDTRPAWEGMKKEELIAILEKLREQASVLSISRDSGSDYIHPTQKPIGLAVQALTNSTLPKDAVLDLFGGSGSTLIACEKHRRRAYLMEKSRGFCDAIVRRFFNTFEEVMIFKNGIEIDPLEYCPNEN